MISLPIISIVACLAYIIFVVYKFGVPVSLSETYYLFKPKWDWMFGVWCVLTASPFGFYWITIAPDNLKWIPIVVCTAMLLIGASCKYKYPDKIVTLTSGTNNSILESNSLKEFFKKLIEKFKPSNFLEFGWARPIHYVSSLVAIILSTIYLCIVNIYAIYSTVFMYAMFILIGIKVDGVYNKAYSTDMDNSAWIFFMEVICFLNLFIFIWL